MRSRLGALAVKRKVKSKQNLLEETASLGVDLPKQPYSIKGRGRWSGGVFISNGRVMVYCPNHPCPSNKKHHVFRYRLVMEKYLGRYLRSDENIHHINGIETDDRIENLEILNSSDHLKHHWIKRKYIYKNMWALKYNQCLMCKKTDRHHYGYGYCHKCIRYAKKQNLV